MSRTPRASGAEDSDQQAPRDEGRWSYVELLLHSVGLAGTSLARKTMGVWAARWGVATGGGISGDWVRVCSSQTLN